ncbi:MAG: penicillin-binding protein activator [Pseudomonadota bacterium]
MTLQSPNHPLEHHTDTHTSSHHVRQRGRLGYVIARALVALGVVGVITGCVAPAERPTQTRYPDNTARALIGEARYEEAADEYVRLAGIAGGQDAVEFRLNAADALRRAGDFDSTQTILNAMPAGEMTIGQRARATLIRARIALDSDNPGQAIAFSDSLDRNTLSSDLQVENGRLRADAYTVMTDHVAAASERVALELLLTEPAAIDLNRRALWHGLQKTSAPTLNAEQRPAPDTLGGWIELALLSRRYIADPPVLNAELDNWFQRYPNHPAGDTVLAEIREEATRVSLGFQHIGLALPFSGPFGEAADAIKDGFTAAWFLDGRPTRPQVTVFDSTDRDPRDLMNEITAVGADVVVGPLRKESVGRLDNWLERPVPVLALNRSPGVTVQAIELQGNADIPSGPPLFQFALSPEDEARRVADRAWADGRVQAVVLTPDSGWGERVADAFTQQWQALGGVVVGAEAYPSQVQEMAAPIKALLGVDASENRRRRLQNVLGTRIEHEPRRRNDVDFIFLAAFPQDGRSLKPQIDFFRGSDLPIYATSHIYTGFPDPGADQDIERVEFGDMPWVLSDDASSQQLRDQIENNWPDASAGFIRFYAFGADAYGLVPNLIRLATSRGEEMQGFTGWLSIEPGNTVKRRLMWAKIRKGYPEITELR